MLLIAQGAARAILDAAAASPDAEICGLLIGAPDRIVGHVPSPNRHPRPSRGFAICDAVHARTQRQARSAGWSVAGCYHSHPSGGVAPSDLDVAAVQENGFIWLIAAPDGHYAVWRAILRPPVKGFSPLAFDLT